MDNERADAVRRAVTAAMSTRHWGPVDLSRESRLDLGTVSDFLDGKRRPRAVTLSRMEAALGLRAGSLVATYAGTASRDPLADVSGSVSDEFGETSGTGDTVLMHLPDGALAGLSPSEREEVMAAARKVILQTAREIRRGLE